MTNNDYRDFDLFGGFGVKLYSTLADHDTICAVWGASTKHPDIKCSMNEDRDNLDFICGIFSSEIENTCQWLMYVASKMSWFITALSILDIIREWEECNK